MKIGVLGSGLMGGNFGLVSAKLGHEVVFSYARNQTKLQSLAAAAGSMARAGTPRQAVEQSDLIVLAVHWLQLNDVLAQAGDLSGKIVLSCTNPLDASNSELVVAHTDSGAETIARKIPGAHVVAAFQATPSEVLQGVFNARGKSPRPNMVFCGDHRESKNHVRVLLEQFGFDPIDAGPLRLARYIEPFAMLATALAYGTDQGPEWVYRFDRLE
ncbi:NADPH-dependent F420 reductase [Dickeya dianthicola]|uniref:Transmembrane reductase oxidoreductase n=1 Tax=Dickeya dianthicola TaxID=204039 RepID=A0AAX1C0L4_9GAMM|nr:NADPH-dependent F420 reductase [Dickeya dianthicola]MCI4004599.1 NADPH-dependent F420 reductase [Dickeya dianthicola]PWD68489.1 transmembrane reductase oxidoreductase [Dickeya dianthicola]